MIRSLEFIPIFLIWYNKKWNELKQKLVDILVSNYDLFCELHFT